MTPHFELFDHTADLGIRIFAGTFDGLIRPATDALYSVIGELAACGPPETLKLDFHEQDEASLLRAYLAELLRLFETSRWMVCQPVVAEFSSNHLRVTGQALRVDPDNSVYNREVKAITYHELAIDRTADGYVATLIVDI